MVSLLSSTAREDALVAAIAPLRERLALHPLYASIQSLDALRIFMQSHVYAVWDFMSLLKALQRALTCVSVPWLPTADPASRRLINEIVLGEESDLYPAHQGGKALSHFELYLHAMESCGAATGPVLALTGTLAAGGSLDEALAAAPDEAAVFVRATFAVLDTGETHRIAAAFTFGREDLIPEMFAAFVRGLDAEFPGRIAPFRYYLERHIEVDGEDHGPMAMEMMRHVCRTDRQWAEAAETACAALEARLALWDGIYARILGSSGSGDPSQVL
jgi:pyrroloquinoline quinone (PQQ) biosynthesis protein C